MDLIFPSDTNQQLAEQALQAQHIDVRRSRPGCLEIDPDELSAHLPAVEEVLAGYSGRLWSD